ncbi:SRPBCC family protein [Massilia sp. 9096]|uniref:SRPBCC family protein n=1 Tax=Massilia sp. 9096 TaxID=1500894 RepID=UPI0009DD76FD|nr:SRPBCC family protein [Massilia sp. 9096]
MKQTTEAGFETGVDAGLELAMWLGAAAAGALLMYMLDPDRGGARRAQSAAAVRGAGSRTSSALGNVWRGAGARVGGLASAKPDGAAGKLGSALSRVGQAAGSMLDDTVSKARSAIGRAGEAAEDSRSQAKSAIARASDSAAEAYEQASRGAGRIGGKVSEAWRDGASGPDAWTPALRNSALIGGGLLALTGLMRRSPIGLALGLAGAALLARGASNRPLGKLAGGLAGGLTGGRSFNLGTGLGLNQTIDLEKSIHIDASPEEVYDLFANHENFPRFMSHVVEVRDLGRRRSHWTVRGPGGSAFEWNSTITEQSRPHRLAWRSEPGAEIPQTGSIQLEPHHGGTDVTVRMSYTPPAGALGHGLATLLGADPKSRLDEDLAHMKAYIERGSDSDETGRGVARGGAQPRSGSRFLH